jgi:hypothetical protein
MGNGLIGPPRQQSNNVNTHHPSVVKSSKHGWLPLHLYIGAPNYISLMGVNATMRGEHEGGFAPFNSEVSSVIFDGNSITLPHCSGELQSRLSRSLSGT